MWKNSVMFVSGFRLVATAAAAILLTSAALAGSKGSGGKVTPHDISVVKQSDQSSPRLGQKSTNATNKQRFDPYKNFKFR
jgi:type VI protein secretion system component Hcp